MVVAVTPAALRHKSAAAFCGVSLATWERLYSARRTPAPVARPSAKIILFATEDLRMWLSLGMPNRDAFEATKAAA